MPCFPPFSYTTRKPNRESLLFYCIRYERLESYILVGWAFHTYLSQKHTTSLLVPDKTPGLPDLSRTPPNHATLQCVVPRGNWTNGPISYHNIENLQGYISDNHTTLCCVSLWPAEYLFQSYVWTVMKMRAQNCVCCTPTERIRDRKRHER